MLILNVKPIGFIRSKYADKIVKPKAVSDENLRDVEGIIMPPEKRGEKKLL